MRVDRRMRDNLYGDVPVVPGNPEISFAHCEARVGQIVASSVVPLVCGGDHAITLPVVRAVAGGLSGRLGLIHLDSHYDLCNGQTASGIQHGNLGPANCMIAVY